MSHLYLPFPTPFAGIEGYVEVDDVALHSALSALITCGHQHNFAVELDVDVDKNRIYTSTMGAQCIAKEMAS